MPKVNLPNDYQWCLLDESTAQDTAMRAPAKRWRAIHNLHDTAVTLLIPGNQVYQHFDKDGDARSDVFNPGNAGELDSNTALAQFSGTVTAVDAGTTTTFTGGASNQDSMTVTRGGVDVTAQIEKPSFDGIDWNGTTKTLTDMDVNGEGAGLEEGDVISFTVTSKDDLTITFTIGEDDLKLADGIYQLKASTDVTFTSVLGADEIIYLNVSEFKFLAQDGGNDAKIVAYFA